jgi:multisubunit Na+/H+ antiporter MnhC subunit
MDETAVGPILYTGAVGLMVIGAYGIVMSRHLVRIILALALLEAGANLFLIMTGFRADAVAPIIVDGMIPRSMVDPIPQALVLTAIVIGVGIQAFAVTLALRLYRAYGTLDLHEIRTRMERDIAAETGTPLPRSADSPRDIHPGPTLPKGGEA